MVGSRPGRGETAMLYVLYLLNALLMIFLPLALATVIERRWSVDWGLFGVGAVTFVAVQVLHIPFNWLLGQWGVLPQDVSTPATVVTTALILGLSAGVFEEVGRYLAYRYWATGARSWAEGLMMGAGHGGIEALLLGLLALVNTLFLFAFQADRLLAVVPAAQQPLLEAQLSLVFSAAWYDALLGALERVLAMTAHLALSVMVLQVFVRRRIRWLWLAIGWHALLDAAAVYALVTWNAYVAELLVGVMALLSGLILWRLYCARPEAVVVPLSAEPLPELIPAGTRPVALDPDKLDDTRFQ